MIFIWAVEKLYLQVQFVLANLWPYMTDGKPRPHGQSGGSDFTASDVKKAAGLSYRQLNDWDSKGALPNQRERRGGWRKFSRRDVFAIMVCKEIRKRFGVPLDSLGFVWKSMHQEGADHFNAAFHLMALGLSVHLLTDLKAIFVMDSDLHLEDLVRTGFFRKDKAGSYILLEVNSLMRRLLERLGMPLRLKVREEYYKDARLARGEVTLHNQQEFEVLRAIRQRDYKRVIVTKKNDEEILLELEQELSRTEAANIDQLLKSHDFQTVTVKRHGGKNVRVTRTLPVKIRRKL